MQIQQAREKASKYINDHLQISKVVRPAPNERVMVRYPAENSPNIIRASDTQELREKLAKRIQAAAKRKATKH